jgi:hypothetical protein
VQTEGSPNKHASRTGFCYALLLRAFVHSLRVECNKV